VTVAARRVKRAVIYGEDGPALCAGLVAAGLSSVDECDSFEGAVRRAIEAAEPGDVVLLSPACASFDQFRDYEERGEAFRDLVRRMTEER
jgi:UDP-N-acetylmuramoylalanine--D-glutamate ligase